MQGRMDIKKLPRNHTHERLVTTGRGIPRRDATHIMVFYGHAERRSNNTPPAHIVRWMADELATQIYGRESEDGPGASMSVDIAGAVQGTNTLSGALRVVWSPSTHVGIWAYQTGFAW